MIVADENVDQVLIDRLEKRDYKILSIREHHAGVSDRRFIEIAKSNQGPVITEDKDFGEFVFSHNIKDCSIIFLRYDKADYDQIEKNIIKALQYYYDNPGQFFIAITKKKIRIRKI